MKKKKKKYIYIYIYIHTYIYILHAILYFSIIYNFNVLKRARTHRLHDIEKGSCPQNFRNVNVSKNMCILCLAPINLVGSGFSLTPLTSEAIAEFLPLPFFFILAPLRGHRDGLGM